MKDIKPSIRPEILLGEVRKTHPRADQDDLDKVLSEIIRELSVDDMLVRRFMVVDADGLAALGASGTIGHHWTTDGSDLLIESLLIPEQADDTWKTIEIRAKLLDPSNIDWMKTVCARFNIPWEKEILLPDDAIIVIDGVSNIHETTRDVLCQERPDLDGVELRAGFPAGPSPAPP